MAVATDKKTIHLSKSSITTWERCRLRYRFDRIDRLQGDGEEPSRAQLVGTAAHEAVAAAITTPAHSGDAVDAVLDGYALTDNDRDAARCWATDAARLAADRGGEPRWVEQLLAMERIPGVTVWGKFDVAIIGGSVAPVEVIDWTFGQARMASEAELAASWGARLYRLLAGTHAPNLTLRPIAITEVHAPTMSVITVRPGDDYVRAAFQAVKELASEIRAAMAEPAFPPTTGPHCRFCAHRSACPAIAAGSDAVPF